MMISFSMLLQDSVSQRFRGAFVVAQRRNGEWTKVVGLAIATLVSNSAITGFGLKRAIGQVVPDTTLPVGEQTLVSPGPVFQIEGGAIRGTNLFHSFNQFSLSNGETATFNPAPTITNIISRVTGGIASNIDGIIQVNGNANLFVINPNGISFGANAQLQIGGSFLATTASAIQFDNQGVFSAVAPETPGLLTVHPSALLFNQLAIQPIEYRANAAANGLQVAVGRSLLLVGGDIRLDGGSLIAPEGRVELAGVASTGSIELSEAEGTFRLSVPDGMTRADISITNQSVIDVRGTGGGSIAVYARNLDVANESFLQAGTIGLSPPNRPSGDVILDITETLTVSRSSRIRNEVAINRFGNAGNILIDTGSLLLSGQSVLSTSTRGRGNGGNVVITADDRVSLDSSSIFSNIEFTGVGQAGSIQIRAGSLLLTSGSALGTLTRGQGKAGNIVVETRDRILLDGERASGEVSAIFSSVEEVGTGKGGDVRLTTNNLVLTNGGQIQALTRGVGDAGNVAITAQDITLDGADSSGEYSSAISTGIEPTGVGKGGTLSIVTHTLSLTNGAQLVAATLGEGDAGDVEIRAVESMYLSGAAAVTGFPTGVFTLSDSAQGKAGNISINTKLLHLSEGANLNALTTGSNDGGDIVLSVGSLILDQGGQLLTTTLTDGRAGKILVDADRVSISGRDPTFPDRAALSLTVALLTNPNSGLYVRSLGSGIAGDIEVNARSFALDQQGQLIAESASGDGGNINLVLQDLLLLRRGSLISTSAGTSFAGGDGGNISIAAPSVVSAPLENSDITANAFAGSGGNVDITAQSIFWLVPRSRAELERLLGTTDPLALNPGLLATNDVTAISQTNATLSGSVIFNSPEVDSSQGLPELPEDLVDASELVSQGLCQIAEDRSEFVMTGRGGLPDSPDEVLSTDVLWEDWRVAIEQAQAARGAADWEREEQRSYPSQPTLQARMVEAQGWIKDHHGNVVLVAEGISVVPRQSWLNPSTCHQLADQHLSLNIRSSH
jgi:filamentous hemagglutinin family protein